MSASTLRLKYLPILLGWARCVIMRWAETVSHEMHVPQQGLFVSLELVAVDYCKEWGCSNFEN